jgi:RimJ/RimL family protein N-acetyltransferase
MNKITFRQLKGSDLEAVYKWVKEIEKEDTFIMMNAAEPIFYKEEKEYFKDLFKKIKQKKIVKIGVFTREKYLGSCDIEKGGKRQGHIGIFGIALSKECRGQGIGYKLAKATIEKAKEQLGIKKIVLNCFANNKVGINFYKKLGFKQNCLDKQSVFYKGRYIDTIWFYKDLA